MNDTPHLGPPGPGPAGPPPWPISVPKDEAVLLCHVCNRPACAVAIDLIQVGQVLDAEGNAWATFTQASRFHGCAEHARPALTYTTAPPPPAPSPETGEPAPAPAPPPGPWPIGQPLSFGGHHYRVVAYRDHGARVDLDQLDKLEGAADQDPLTYATRIVQAQLAQAMTTQK